MFKKKELRLIKEFAISDFKLKYKRSVLGYFWSLIKPLLMLATLYIVFSVFINLEIQNYPIFLLLGIILWNFFAEATSSSMSSVLAKANLIKKVSFSKSTVILASCLSAFLTLLINIAVFILFMVIFKISFSWTALLFPFYLIEFIIFIVGISFALSALHIKYRDIAHIWEILLQIGFWITPIIYPLTKVSFVYRKWYLLNPLARIIDDSRNALIYGIAPNLADFSAVKHIFITIIICILIFIFGWRIFKKMSHRFSEYL